MYSPTLSSTTHPDTHVLYTSNIINTLDFLTAAKGDVVRAGEGCTLTQQQQTTTHNNSTQQQLGT